VKGRLRATLTIIVGLTIAVFIGRWVYYRWSHVVASYAFVKGAVAQVGAPVPGQVVAVEVRAGQRVSRGDVLLRMNDVKQKALVEQARAAWHQATVELRVERIVVATHFQKVGVVSAQAKAKLDVTEALERAAKVDSQLAERQAERSSALHEKDMLSAADHDVAKATDRVAREKVKQAHGKVDLAQAQVASVSLQESIAKAREAHLELLEAAVETAKAALDAAEADLSLTVIRASESGVVARRLVEPGAGVRLGSPMLEIWYDTNVWVEAWVDESKYGELSIGDPVETVVPGTRHAPYAGHIAWLGVVTELELKDASFSIPIAKTLAQSHWVRVQVALDSPDSLLLPGLSIDVAVPRKRPFLSSPPQRALTPVSVAPSDKDAGSAHMPAPTPGVVVAGSPP
jgi:multidrug resistance efflux pump